MAWYTGKGDEGYTDLIGGKRVAKDDPRIETLGDLDEAMAALGAARAFAVREGVDALVLRVQQDLYLLMAEVASPNPEQLSARLGAAAVAALEDAIASLEREHVNPHGFIAPGDTRGGTMLDVARTVVRRAERRVTSLVQGDALHNAQVIRYLNRLSSLLFLLARAEDQAAGGPGTRLGSSWV